RSSARRRHVLSTVGAAAVAGLAGCSTARFRERFGIGGSGTDANGTADAGTETSGDATATPTDGPKPDPDGWPRYHYDAWNTGARTDRIGFDDQPTMAWYAQVGNAGPAVVDGGTVFVAESDAGAVRAFDAASGEQQWVYDAVGDVPLGVQTVAIDDGTVYVGGETAVHAIDRASGSQRWTFETGGIHASTPAVVDGTVYVGAGDTFYAIDSGGDRKWYLKTGTRQIRTPPAVVGDTLYLTTNAMLFAIDRESGEEHWSLKPAGLTPPSSAPTYRYGRLYVAGPLHVYAYDPTAEGEHVWSSPTFGQVVYQTPTVAHGTVYTGVSLVDKFHALDAETGGQTWVRDITVSQSPVATGDTVYVVDDEQGVLHAIDPDDGSDRWTFTLSGGIYGQPSITDDRIYVSGTSPDGNGFVFALEDR
ncbi:MAG: PQQ-binding-like beta-propeller repeat protein, partial [Haloarculaceae archaeon]